MTVLVADIGGTHARFAFIDDGQIVGEERVRAADYPSLEDAVRSYCVTKNLTAGGDISIAVAANKESDGVWRFIGLKSNPWVIDPAALTKVGWKVRHIVSDFAASARGALTLGPESLVMIRDVPRRPEFACVILGAGTGLGLSYMIPQDNSSWHVHATHGGHMLAAALSDEQKNILSCIHYPDRVTIWEDVASGWGLPGVYRAVCTHNNIQPVYQGAEEILQHVEDPMVIQTLRLFHEFLGLFAHHAVVTGHAYGGLYIDGGLTHRLYQAGLFDEKSFMKFFDLPLVPIVQQNASLTPVMLVNDPFVALKGLRIMAETD